MITLDSVKQYIRVDNDAENAFLQSLIAASESYLEGAVTNFTARYTKSVEDNDKWHYKADLARLMLIADWYENRLQEEKPVNSAINMMLTQLDTEGAMLDESYYSE